MLEGGSDPFDVLDAGRRAMGMIGQKFEAGEYFLGELIQGGQIAEKCIALIDPHLPKGRGAPRGVVVIGAGIDDQLGIDVEQTTVSRYMDEPTRLPSQTRRGSSPASTSPTRTMSLRNATSS